MVDVAVGLMVRDGVDEGVMGTETVVDWAMVVVVDGDVVVERETVNGAVGDPVRGMLSVAESEGDSERLLVADNEVVVVADRDWDSEKLWVVESVVVAEVDLLVVVDAEPEVLIVDEEDWVSCEGVVVMGRDKVAVSSNEVVVERLAVSVAAIVVVSELESLTDVEYVFVVEEDGVSSDIVAVPDNVDVSVLCVWEVVMTLVSVLEGLVVIERESVVDTVIESVRGNEAEMLNVCVLVFTDSDFVEVIGALAVSVNVGDWLVVSVF